jgi:hypothetical protein
MAVCAREGCKRQARGDEFCGQLCAKIAHGVIPFDPDAARNAKNARRRRRRIAEKYGAQGIEVENTDAMTRIVSGGYGTGKRR